MNLNNDIKFWMPLDTFEKGKNEKGQEVMKFKGLASTSSEDADGEYLDYNGFDLSQFQFVNWNHLKDPKYYIGQPTNWEIVPGVGLMVEGELFPEQEVASQVWNLGKALKNSKAGGNLGISVEGQVLERDPGNPQRVIKSKITAIALCPHPKNADTWADFITKGYTSNEPYFYEYSIQKGENGVESKYIYDFVNNSGDRVLVTDDLNIQILKSISAEGLDSQGAVKESLDKKKKKLEDLDNEKDKENNQNSSNFKPDLKKSQVYEEIFKSIPGIDSNTAKAVYQTIRSMSGTKITLESIEKGLSLLTKLGEQGITPTSATTIVKATTEKEVEALLQKSVTPEDIKVQLLEKGHKEEDIQKSLDAKSTPVLSAEEIEIQKLEKSLADAKEALEKAKTTDPIATPTTDPIEKAVRQEDLEKAVKPLGDQITKGFETVSSLIQTLQSNQDTLKKSLEEQDLKIQKISETPNERRSITKSYTPDGRLQDSPGNQNNGLTQVSASNPQVKQALIKSINDSISYKDENPNMPLLDSVAKYEAGNIVTPILIQKAKELGYQLVQ